VKSQSVSEIKVVSSLALLYAFRMLGLFMVLPVLMLYGDDYRGSTPFLLGLALGVYGLTQACLQIPLGLLSDIWGRKPVIFLGLVVFAAGSLLAASADTVTGLIIGRALQGAGAIASAIMALVADLTSEQNRTKAMAGIGASIGVAFSVALVLGPVVAGLGGMAAVFGLSATLAGIGLLVVWRLIPDPSGMVETQGDHRHRQPLPGLVLGALRNPELLRLDWGIFCLHFMLMASFVAVPGMLETFGFDRETHWQIYLPVMLLSFIAMLPFMVLAERKRQVKQVFLGAIAVLGGAELGLAQWHGQMLTGLALLFVFFIAFNLLEATLPSLISKLAPAESKGTAMGVYSTSQFLGAFVGGSAGGLALQYWGLDSVFLICGVIASVWWLVGIFMRPPRYLSSMRLRVAGSATLAASALKLPGVEQAHWAEVEGLLCLKVDERKFDHKQLQSLLTPATGDSG
jgi:MFS family permease